MFTLPLAWFRRVWANVEGFVEEVNDELFSYIVTLILTLVLAFWFESRLIAFIGYLILCLMGHSISVRLAIAAAITRLFRRSRPATPPAGDTPTVGMSAVHKVWYWSSFVSMWTSLPVLVIAITAPWEHGNSVKVLAATFTILHCVATQKEFGDFWRKVYYGLAFTIASVIMLSNFFYGDWMHLLGGHERGQLVSVLKEAASKEDGDVYTKQLYDVRVALRKVRASINADMASSRNVPAWKTQSEKDLTATEARLEGLIDTVPNQVIGTFTKQTSSNGSYSVFWGFLFLACAFWALGELGLFDSTKSESAHGG